jgi:hypothetical protein
MFTYPAAAARAAAAAAATKQHHPHSCTPPPKPTATPASRTAAAAACLSLSHFLCSSCSHHTQLQRHDAVHSSQHLPSVPQAFIQDGCGMNGRARCPQPGARHHHHQPPPYSATRAGHHSPTSSVTPVMLCQLCQLPIASYTSAGHDVVGVQQCRACQNLLFTFLLRWCTFSTKVPRYRGLVSCSADAPPAPRYQALQPPCQVAAKPRHATPGPCDKVPAAQPPVGDCTPHLQVTCTRRRKVPWSQLP